MSFLTTADAATDRSAWVLDPARTHIGFAIDLPEGEEGGVSSAMAPTDTRRVRFCGRRSADWELTACELAILFRDRDERRADDHRRNKGRFGAS